MMSRDEDKKILQSLNAYAIPLIIQFFSNYIINLTDQAIIGRISAEAYGVIGIVNAFHNMIVGIVGCTTVSFNIRASRRKGKATGECIFRQEFKSSIFLSGLIGILFLVFDNLFKKIILEKLYGFAGEGLEIGIRFFTIASSYVLVQMLLFSYGQFFKIQNKTKYLLIGSTISAVLNVVLDYVLVFGKYGFPKLDVEGAALATILSMTVNLTILMFVSRHIVTYKTLRRSIENRKKIFLICRQQLIESLPLMGQELLEGSVFTVAIQSIISRMGGIELSTYLILQQIIKFLYVPMNMYGSAVLTLTGRKLSEKNESYYRVPLLGGLISSILYIIPGIVFIMFRAALPTIITNDVKVIHMSITLLPLAIICNAIKPACTIYKNAALSMGRSKFVLYSSAAVNAMILLVLFLRACFLSSSLMGVFFCEMINNGILFWIFYKKIMKQKKL